MADMDRLRRSRELGRRVDAIRARYPAIKRSLRAEGWSDSNLTELEAMLRDDLGPGDGLPRAPDAVIADQAERLGLWERWLDWRFPVFRTIFDKRGG